MCGIIFAVSHHEQLNLSQGNFEFLKARGPDSLIVHQKTVQQSNGLPRYLTFAASVLSLRDNFVQKQPLIDVSTGSLLCWNGEAWTIDGNDIQGNDAQIVFHQLLTSLSSCNVGEDDIPVRSQVILDVLTRIAGPYAVLYFDAPTSNVYFARDRLGRRSLMIYNGSSQSNEDGLADTFISSFDVTETALAQEVQPLGVYRIYLRSVYVVPILLAWQTPNPSLQSTPPSTVYQLLKTPSEGSIETMKQYLTNSIRYRVLNIPTYNVVSGANNTSHPSRLAILFSGGLDCTLLARMCHDILPTEEPIDLLNVAFENPRVVKAAQSLQKYSDEHSKTIHELCPDRVTGRSSHTELEAACPNRLWRFVAIDIPYADVLEHRSTIIRLMRPHNTEMDLSIAMALYFAARGKGHIQPLQSTEKYQYTTTARVLLSGLGADELFGGYSRHAAAFTRGGFDALNQELELDFTRIGSRNLGRDDRVMAHWSREVRYPYLDEKFVRFALQLPAWEKVGFRTDKKILKHFEDVSTLSSSTGDIEKPEDLDPAKMILRCLAWNLGMKKAAAERKRAIQFGARTAKMHAGRTKGTDVLTI